MAETLYSREQIEQCQEALQEMAQRPRTTFTKKQAVEALIESIEKALKTRSFQEVADGLVEQGLEVSAGTLKQYVSRYRRDHKKGTPKKRGRKTGMGDQEGTDKKVEQSGEKPLDQSRKGRIPREPDSQPTSDWPGIEDEFNL